MSRITRGILITATVLAFCSSVYSQDSPSLGDLARQSQKDKSGTPPKKVFTNDDLPQVSRPAPPVPSGDPGAGVGQPAQPASPTKQDTPEPPAAGLGQLESMLNQVASLDRATLAKTVLDTADVNFPGRTGWENKLVAARDAYVVQGHALLQKARQIESSMADLKGIPNPDDPLVKDLSNQLQKLEQDGNRAGTAFEAVIMEGRGLAGQSLPQ